MIDFSNIKTLFFDYDGTLHNSMVIYKPAFLKAQAYLEKAGHLKPAHYDDTYIRQFLGMTPKAMWDAFGHALPKAAKDKASKIIGQSMAESIEKGEAKLYEGALKTLHALKEKGYTLVFISNCNQYYLDAHAKQFELTHIFDRMVCSETFDDIQEKHAVLARIKDDFPKEQLIIGDRIHDMEAGSINSLKKIGCSYGFGPKEELASADFIIDDIKDLQKLL